MIYLTKWTLCLCSGCGHVVVGAHDCDRQYAENQAAKPRSNLEYLIRLLRSSN